MNAEEQAARIELRALIDEYASALDSNNAELLESLFVPAGYLAIGRDGEDPIAELSGASNIPRILKGLKTAIRTQHLMANHRCEIGDAAATGQVYALAGHIVTASDGSHRNVHMALVYDDEYARTENGWKFMSRRIRELWREVTPVDLDSYGINAE